MLKVLIVGAHDLENVAPDGAEQQPFYILECGAQRSRSKAARRGGCTSPEWHTAHRFAVSDEVAVNAVIKDELTKELIGEGSIDLERWADGHMSARVAGWLGGWVGGCMSGLTSGWVTEGLLPPLTLPVRAVGPASGAEDGFE
jgi:hypothetical protein